MANWAWASGEVKGRCPICTEPLRHADILIEWAGRTYHVGCALDFLTTAASPPLSYQLPGADWKAP